jgi:23S rRNA (uracil1939-C5)-methyltransferase
VTEAAELRVAIERLADGGEGVAHAPDGRVVFVPATAPGDEVRVRIVEEHPRWLRAELVAVDSPGPGRTEPRCELVGRCGGCAWQHLAYETQREAKGAILRDALERIGRLEVPGPIEVVASPPFGYRGRARIGTARGVVGYRRLRSHSLEPTNACPVLAPALEEALAELAAAPPKKAGEIELALGDDGAVRAWGPGGALLGERALSIAAGDRNIQVSPGVFFQGNAELRGALLEGVLDAAGEGERAVELCAGAGFFTLALAQRFAEVVAVESSPPAVRDLRQNIDANGAGNVRVECAPLERLLGEELLRDLTVDALVVDPPRTGLGKEVAEGIASLDAKRVVYVSCAPSTLARDLAVMVRSGFGLEGVRGFDLFPQTPHVEAIALLRR